MAESGEVVARKITGERAIDVPVNGLSSPKGGYPEAKPEPSGKIFGKQKRSVVSRHPNIQWKEKFRGKFLEELLHTKGRADTYWQRNCSDCKEEAKEEEKRAAAALAEDKVIALRAESRKSSLEREKKETLSEELGKNEDAECAPSRKGRVDRTPRYRCKDCFMGDMVCKKCCARRHWDNPFHRVEKWNGQMFEQKALADIGVTIMLNHFSGYCPKPRPSYQHLLVFHTNGIHRVNILFCDCEKRTDEWRQLMRRGLYPRNLRTGRISTVATFQYLDSLHMHTLTTKGSIYDFYRALEKITNNTGLALPKSRSGRGQAEEEWSDDKEEEEGALALRCPSCPHPGINLPADWKQRAKGAMSLVLCMDANFRLKEQLVSSHSRDPALSDGLGYFVKRGLYEEWLEKNAKVSDKEDEISNCVPFAAMEKQNSKFSKGLRYTGIAAVVCGRTDFVLKLVNLNKGERYSCMDYLLAKALQRFLSLFWLLLCYDIACQWFQKLDKRERAWPELLRLWPGLKMTPGIGKMHEPGHKQKKHKEFSLNLILGAGRTDGESNERVWGPHNGLGNATKTSGPGARQDLLEAQFDFWNWLKYITMATQLYQRWRSAVDDKAKLDLAHDGLTKGLPQELVSEWRDMLKKWEEKPFPKAKEDDDEEDNPFRVKEEFLSQAKALKELEEEDEAQAGKGKISFHRMSALGFVVASLDLQEAQHKLKQMIDEQKREPTICQSNKTRDQRRAIKRCIQALAELRAIYMPSLAQYKVDKKLEDGGEDMVAEEMKVWLPSDIPPDDVSRVCMVEAREAEKKLQFARANDALDGLRHTLRVKSCMVVFKNTHVRGQRDSGRAQGEINNITSRVNRFAGQYRRARTAYYGLTSEGDEELGVLPVLASSDIRSLQDPERKKRGPGRKGMREDDLEVEVEVEDDKEGMEREEELQLVPPDLSDWSTRKCHGGTGETQKVNSWIWEYNGGRRKMLLEDGADDDNELLRTEWCKSQARVNRVDEELLLLKEEMRRTVAYMAWARDRWKEYVRAAEKQMKVAVELAEGRRAYAMQQSCLQDCLRAACEGLYMKMTGNSALCAEGDDWDEAAVVKEEEEERRLVEEGDDVDDEADDADDYV
ncbi:hypothetical protein V5O48_016361 [Marasmius crinis-equi]|uniref:CxC2-like cysteine cluster KDZ transposase-associated domain-containing protein n=1 Tax=Marasmius crinis-equi TaxID=585013 RepID=A0ABR3ERZ8_9AGAR